MFARMFTSLLEEGVEKETGRVKWVDDMDALGIISTQKGIDVPFYFESIGFEMCKTLREGEDVEVEFEISSEGLLREALNIHKISKGIDEI